MTRKSLIKKIEKFNAELNEYYETTGDDYLYDVGTTIIGSTSYVAPFEITEFEDRVEFFGGLYGDEHTEVYNEYFEETYNYIIKMFLDDIRYYRRMLKKSWRIWKSENPDTELENEDE